MIERELKLLVGPELILDGLDDAVPGADLGPAEEIDILDTYYDTADLRLARWGCTLRFRAGDGWTVKLPTPVAGPILAREEITIAGEAATPPAEVLALVRSLTRGSPVDAVARFDTVRTARRWSDGDGALVAELVDDRVAATTDRGEQTWRELEVELGPEVRSKVARRIVKRIEATAAAHPTGDGRSVPVRSESRPKLVRAIGVAAEAPPDVVVPELDPRSTAREVIQAAIARSTTKLILCLPAARLGRDIEGVHQARVATRRLRSNLRTFRPLLDSTWARDLSEELRWLADDLGRVRDADVLIDRIRSIVAAEPALAGEGSTRVIAALQRQRTRDNRRLHDHLDSERTDRLLDRLRDAADDPRTDDRADDPATDRLGPLVARRWRRLDKAIRGLDDPPTIDELHTVRIRAKRVRYALEATEPVDGRATTSLRKSVEAIQDALGEVNDAAAAEARLAAMAERTKGSTAFAAGRLCQAIDEQTRPDHDRWQRHGRRARKAAGDLRWRR